MSKITTFLMLTRNRKTGEVSTQEVKGQVAYFMICGHRHKFFIHDGSLSNYRRGYKFGDLNAIKVERMARISTYTRTTDRQAAEILIERTIISHGIEKVVEELNKHPTINDKRLTNNAPAGIPVAAG